MRQGELAYSPGDLQLWVGDATGTAPQKVAGVGIVVMAVGADGLASVNGSVSVSDAQSAAFSGAVAITPGTPTTALRSLGYICTAAGNITLTLTDASTLTLPIQPANGAFQTLPFAVTNVALGSGTAGNFWNLK